MSKTIEFEKFKFKSRQAKQTKQTKQAQQCEFDKDADTPKTVDFCKMLRSVDRQELTENLIESLKRLRIW